jgi:hypothetical protein
MKGRVIIRFSLFALSCSQFLLLSEISRGQNNFFPSGISVNQIVCTSTDPQCVWTYHNDNTRGGVNPNETTINPSTVGGLVASSVLTDGLIYAQPLFISNIPTSTPTCSPGNHNIVYVVTENNTVYAYDTASPGNLVNCWTTHLGPSAGEAFLESSDDRWRRSAGAGRAFLFRSLPPFRTSRRQPRRRACRHHDPR